MKTIDVMDGSSEITWRHFLWTMKYYLVPCALQRHVQQTMRHVVISAAVDTRLSQSEDVYL